ncbi:MAG: hypothetical protein R3234_09685 [Thermoanaerobaculia bacterium]|nr:hypothetical protein [Thermoanaerobaculia bacterium]
MSYPGNPSLAEDVRERILETWEHTRNVAEEGKTEEARLGCDFILRLDPLFSPAQRLADRLEESSGGPVRVDDLEDDLDLETETEEAPAPEAPAAGTEPSPEAPGVQETREAPESSAPAAEAPGPTEAAEASEVGEPSPMEMEGESGLGEIPELPMEEVSETAGPEAPGGPDEVGEAGAPLGGSEAMFASELRSEFAELVATRDFDTLMARAEEEKEAISEDPELQRLLGDAQEQMEAAPYVESFLSQAEEALAAEDEEAARSALEKARSLDPGHPRLQQMETTLGTVATPEPVVEPSEPGEAEEPLPEGTVEPEAEELESAPTVGGAEEIDLGAEEPIAEFEMDELPELPDAEEEPVEETLETGEDVEPSGEEAEELPFPEEDLGFEDLGELPELEDEEELELGEPEAVAAEEPGEEPVERAPEEEAEASPAAPSDEDPRIAELLAEGQESYEKGEFQEAIDAWSRIFLIDIDHQEAARRIEEARENKAEEDRRVEEAYHEALSHVEAREMEEAEAKLRDVLEMSPNHVAASEYLEKLGKGELAPEDVTEEAAGEAAPAAPLMEPEEEGGDVLKEEIMVPPEPDLAPEEPVRPTPEETPEEAPSSRKNLILVAAGILVTVLAVGGFLWFRSGSLFPNTESAETPASPSPAETTTPIERATELFEEGKTGVAIAQLKRLPPASPHYEEAQALLSEWETGEEEAGEELSPEAAARREELLAEARNLQSEGRHLEAIEHLREAGTIEPLGDEGRSLLQESEEAILPLEPLIDLVRAGEYDRALRDLWLQREENPNDPVVTELIADSYFNLGVRSLQQGRPVEAKEHFSEVLNVTPEDQVAERLFEFADTYEERNRDLLFRIYVKYLSPRSV